MPLVSKTFDQLLDFTRTTAATFVGSNGLIQTTPASVNLLTYTQEFDNAAWTKNGSTVTANTTAAPDGTSTADKLVENTATAQHLLARTENVASAPVTFSVYAKAAERSWISLYIGAVNTSAFFNLSTGTVGTVQASVTASITSVGNGWYRCSITAASVGNGSLTRGIYVANADNSTSYTGDGTSGIFIWGAQLQTGSTATTYTRNNGGVFPPRFDYDPVTLAPKGIMIEEQRANLALQSETFDSGTWAKFQATATANATVSPDGATDADALVEDANTGGHFFQQFLSFTSGVAYTISLYVKAGTRSWMSYGFPSSAFGASTGGFFDLSGAGALGTANGTPTSRTITAVGNGWYRITVTATATATAGGNVVIAAASANGTTSYVGVAGAEALYLYGAQLEAGAFATSYIPTVASQVTRTADQTSIVAPNFAPWYNQSEGTFVVDASPTNNGCYALAATDGTANEEIILRYASTGTAAIVRDGGAIQANFGTGVLTGKNALAYKVNDFAVSTNGGAAATDTSGTVPTNNQVSLGAARDGTLNINGHIRSIRYYPTRLSNAQLQALTA
jgi:hypothetical protein